VPITDPGTYHVLIDNTFSIFTTKYVSADIRFLHEGIDVARANEIESKAKERKQRVGQILGKLVTALGTMDKEWGTSQVSPPVYFTIVDDPSINAAADWSRKFIFINRGLLEFAESLGPKEGDDMIAGVLAHELGHIFYHHAYGDPQRQVAGTATAGLAGALMVNPLVGFIAAVLAYDYHHTYDRQQETEADLLGIRVACAADFNPRGLITFMAKGRELYPTTEIGFLKTHPSSTYRIEYLEKELMNPKCLRELPG
jgi:predicted Zn-dependent protease